MVDVSFMTQIPLFAQLAEAEQKRLAGLIHERACARGTVIFAEGEPGQTVYFVREGRVKIYRVTSTGEEQILGIFTAGQPFGLIVAIDGSPYPATAETMEESRIWSLRREELHHLMSGMPGLMTGTMREVGDRLRKAQSRVHSLGARTVRQRVAEYLLERAGNAPGSEVRMQLGMTHQELGAYLGATRESVSRALADLRRQGVIRPEGEDRWLIRPAALQDEI